MGRVLNLSLLMMALLMIVASTILAASTQDQIDSKEKDQTPPPPTGILSRFGLNKLPEMFSFEKFKQMYGRHYSSPVEESRRSVLFLPRALQVYVTYANYLIGRSSKFLAINHMSDMTPEERESRLLPPDATDGTNDENGESKLKRRKRAVFEVPPHERSLGAPSHIVKQSDTIGETRILENPGNSGLLSGFKNFVKHPFYVSKGQPSGRSQANHDEQVLLDYRENGCFAEVKDQGPCAACYIFSITSVFEYLHCNQTGKSVPFAEQYVLDCANHAKDIDLGGCHSARPEATWLFIQRFGLELSDQYPYSARVNTCPYPKSADTSHMGHTHVREVKHVDLNDSNRKKEIISDYLKEKGPLVIGLKVEKQFVDYGGGVDNFKYHWLAPKHAMTVVGEGIEGGQEYWLIRNSMGKDWGLDGYYKLSKEIDPRILIKISYVETKFDKNKKHDEQKLRQALASRH